MQGPPCNYIRGMVRSRVRLGLVASGLAGLLWMAHWLATPPAGVPVARREMRLMAPEGNARVGEAPWRSFDDAVLVGWRGPYELRYQFQIADADAAVPLGVHIALRAGFTASWDGVALPPNGQPGNDRASERPGRVDWVVPVPSGFSQPGTHELRLVASSHGLATSLRSSDARVRVAAYDALLAAPYRAWLIPLMAMGCVLAGACYVAVILLGSPKPSQSSGLLLSMAGSGVLLSMAEGWRALVGYAYPWHGLRLSVVLALTALTMGLMVGYFASRFSTPRWFLRPPWSVGIAALVGLPFVLGLAHFDATVWLLHMMGLSLSLFITVRAARLAGRASDTRPRTSPDIVAALIATALVAAALDPSAYIDGLYTISLAVIMAVVLLGHATHQREIAARALALENSRVRLTSALLRKSIQPHWLMNTLTSLQELIEVDPSRASRLVDLLGDEFRMVTEASTRPLIAARRELQLCQTHLAIVSLALPAPRRLDVEGEDLLEGVALPPGILHTLVENGLTHGGVDAPTAGPDFTLTVRRTPDVLVLTLRTPAAKQSAAIRETAPEPARGTGTQFVEASLEAAFPSQWRLEQGESNGRWQTTIALPYSAARHLHDTDGRVV